MRLEILVATMYQKDCQLVEKMNLCGGNAEYGVILANQADRDEIVEDSIQGTPIKMITTKTKGVGLNRNIALMASTADILLFSDEDVTYYDNFQENVCAAFENNEKADVIIFSMHITKDNQITNTVSVKNRRLYLINSLKYGTYVVAIRRSAFLKSRICFSQLFGGGCKFSCGEDSLFISDCFKNGLNVYGSSFVLGECAKDESTWFSGYHKKFFYDKGVFIACMYPRVKQIMKWYYIFRFIKHTELSLAEIRYQINNGIEGFSTLRLFTDNKNG